MDSIGVCRSQVFNSVGFGEIADFVWGDAKLMTAVKGSLSYSWADDLGNIYQVTEPFRADISLAVIEVPNELAECGDGFGGSPEALRYQDVKLPINRRDYVVDLPLRGNKNISSYTARLKMSSEMSSFHQFQAVAKFADGSERRSEDREPVLLPAETFRLRVVGDAGRLLSAAGFTRLLKYDAGPAQSHHQAVNLQVNNSRPCINWESLTMKQRTLALLTTGILSALLCSAPGFAGDYSAGKEASGEAPRAMGSASEFKGAKAKPVPGIQADRSASRDVLLDDAAIAKAYTIIGRSSDGRDVKLAPSDAVIDAIKNAKAGGKRTRSGRRRGRPRRLPLRATSSARTIACRSPRRRPIPTRRSAISRWRPRRARCGAARRR